MIRALGLFVALVAPATAFALPINAVLSVPENGGSRLELSHWPQNGWAVQQFGKLVEIRFPGSDLAITPQGDLVDSLGGSVDDVVYEQRDGDTFLRLTLGCECSVALQGDGQHALHIEIVGGRNQGAPEGVGRLALNTGTAPAPIQAPAPKPKPDPVVTAEAGQDASTGGEINVDEARERLLEQLMKAAEAGIVDLEEPATATPEAEPEPMTPAVAEAQPDGLDGLKTESESNHSESSNITASGPTRAGGADTHAGQTGHAPAAGGDGAESEHATAQETWECFQNEMFVFQDALDRKSFPDRLARLRGDLIGEFDKPNIDHAVALAKTYLGQGLAHEAHAVLAGFSDHNAQTQPYADMSALLIHGTLAEGSALLRPDCLGDQALWRAYARARQGDNAGALEDEISSGRALDRLPLYLRQTVAAELGLASADIGDWENARRLEAIARRAANSANDALEQTLLLSARLAEWHNKAQDVHDLLQLARAERAGSTGKATLETARRWLRLGQPQGLDIAGLRQDLGALARRERGTDIGADAFRLEARLVANSATREDVVELLAFGVSAGLLPEADQAGLMTDLVAAPTSIDGTEPLALTYLRDPNRFEAALREPVFRRSLVRSLAEIGAPSLAKPLLDQGDLQDEKTAIALAEGFISTGQLQDAFDATAGLADGQEKRLAEVAAMIATGQLARASKQLLPASGQDQESARWLALARKLQRAATGAGKIEIALAAAEAILEVDEDTAIARRAALLALELGHPSMPKSAAQILRDQDAESFAALDLLFRPALADADVTEKKAVAAYIAELDAEMAAIMEFLEDG